MIPGARLDGARTMGEGKHLRCTVNSAGLRVGAVAFGSSRLPDGADHALDVVGSLEVNRWRGNEELRFVIAQTAPPSGTIQLVGRPDDDLDATLAALASAAGGESVPASEGSRETLDRRGAGIAGALGALVAGGESVVVVSASEQRRRAQLTGRIGGFALSSWKLLLADSSLVEPFTHLVALDPPSSAEAELLMTCGPAGSYAHQLWGPAELRFTLDEIDRNTDLRGSLASVYRALRDSPELPLLDQLRSGDENRAPAEMALIIRVLDQLQLASFDGSALTLPTEAPRRRELDESAAFIENAREAEEAREWLSPIASLAA